MMALVITEDNFVAELGDICETDTGLRRRDLVADPVGRMVGSSGFDPGTDCIPRDEWTERARDLRDARARISDLRTFDALDQNGQGYCWCYASVVCVMLLRAMAGLPTVRLSPHGLACRIMDFKDRGAWNALAMRYLIEWGCPSEEFWPQQSMRRPADWSATWADAQKYRITEGYVDLDGHPADAHLTEDGEESAQKRLDVVVSCLLTGIPVAGDFYHMGHAVALMDLEVFDEVSDLSDLNRWGIRFLNSYGPSWKGDGTAVLRGKLAVPDGATAPRAVVVS